MVTNGNHEDVIGGILPGIPPDCPSSTGIIVVLPRTPKPNYGPNSDLSRVPPDFHLSGLLPYNTKPADITGVLSGVTPYYYLHLGIFPSGL